MMQQNPWQAYGTAPVHLPVAQNPGPEFSSPSSIPETRFTPLGYMAASLTITSAATIGANMVEVQEGTITPGQAILDGVAKGAAASVIMSLMPKQTVFDIALTATALAGSAYFINKVVKKAESQGREVPKG